MAMSASSNYKVNTVRRHRTSSIDEDPDESRQSEAVGETRES